MERNRKITTSCVRERRKKSSTERIVVDCAGAVEGGAARLLREMQTYLAEARLPHVELIGAGQQLTSQWLVKREFLAVSANRRISLNNAGFVNPSGTNVTLLRNILHFATADDLKKTGFYSVSPP